VASLFLLTILFTILLAILIVGLCLHGVEMVYD
jgi:hypothetical protein